jgi:hypothetical protein
MYSMCVRGLFNDSVSAARGVYQRAVEINGAPEIDGSAERRADSLLRAAQRQSSSSRDVSPVAGGAVVQPVEDAGKK